MLGAQALYGAVPVTSSLGGPFGALPARYMHTEQAHSLPLLQSVAVAGNGMVTLLVYTPDQKVHARSKRVHAPS